MMLKRIYYLSLAVFFVTLTINSCGQKNNNDRKNRISNFIKIAKNEPIEIFENWNVWKRSDGIVFDFMNNKYRLLVVNKKDDYFLFKEIFPKQDSVFHSLLEIESRSDHYPFHATNFSDKVFLFKKLKVDQVNSIIEDSIIMFVNEDFSIIYTQKGTDVSALNRYKEYSKYDSNWYYYLKVSF
jgi:hypothetical protein